MGENYASDAPAVWDAVLIEGRESKRPGVREGQRILRKALLHVDTRFFIV
jgi:hypothetical protein